MGKECAVFLYLKGKKRKYCLFSKKIRERNFVLKITNSVLNNLQHNLSYLTI